MSVSILLPFYNRAHTLARCVESVRAQTMPDWELIAVDDGSTDGSAALLASYGDARIRVLRHAENRGPSAARNTALAEARGEQIALLDSDDEWLPAKLERQLAHLQARALDACGCEYWLIAGEREELVRLPAPASWAAELHTRCRLGNGTTLLARRACCEAIGPFDEKLRLYEDWDWVLRLAGRFRYGVVEEPLARVHVSGPRSPQAFAEGARRFLSRHDAEFRRLGWRGRREVYSCHYENVAANAFGQRVFGLGAVYTLASVFAAPWRRPQHLGALLLAPIDRLCGTSLLKKAAGWERRP